MNISFTISSWMVPVVITVASLIAIFIAASVDSKNSGGYFNFPFCLVIVAPASLIGVIVAWVVYGLMKFFK